MQVARTMGPVPEGVLLATSTGRCLRSNHPKFQALVFGVACWFFSRALGPRPSKLFSNPKRAQGLPTFFPKPTSKHLVRRLPKLFREGFGGLPEALKPPSSQVWFQDTCSKVSQNLSETKNLATEMYGVVDQDGPNRV